MAKRHFRELLEARWADDWLVCAGLDSDLLKLPEEVRHVISEKAIVDFNCQVVEAVAQNVCAFKPNLAFYISLGPAGFTALARTMDFIHHHAPEVPVILDAKFADIGNTNKGYAQAAFDYFGADAITVHPYLGREALRPFLDRGDKGIIVLCRTSNPGAGEFQDLTVTEEGMTVLYKYVAHQVAKEWNTKGNCAVVAGATYPEELGMVRQIVGDEMPILIPGLGKQTKEMEAKGINPVELTVKLGLNKQGIGAMFNVSRSLIFASPGPEFAQAAADEATRLHNEINEYRQIMLESRKE